MFLLFFGISRRIRSLGAGALRTCPRCHNTATWQRIRHFTQLSLFFVPVLRWGRRETECCPICRVET